MQSKEVFFEILKYLSEKEVLKVQVLDQRLYNLILPTYSEYCQIQRPLFKFIDSSVWPMQRAFRECHDDEAIKNSVDNFGEFSIQKVLKNNKI